MEKYRKFTIEAVALMNHITATMDESKDGTIAVDARMFKALAKIAENVSNGWMHHMDFKLEEQMRAVGKRFDAIYPPSPPKKRGGRKKDVPVKVETFTDAPA